MTYETGDWCVSLLNLADNIGYGEKDRTTIDSEK